MKMGKLSRDPREMFGMGMILLMVVVVALIGLGIHKHYYTRKYVESYAAGYNKGILEIQNEAVTNGYGAWSVITSNGIPAAHFSWNIDWENKIASEVSSEVAEMDAIEEIVVEMEDVEMLEEE